MDVFLAYIAIGVVVGFLAVIVSIVIETTPPDIEDSMMTFGACALIWPLALIIGSAYGLVILASRLGLALRNKYGSGVQPD